MQGQLEEINRKDHGFSLIEVIIVISLMAVVYVVAVPNLSITTTSSIASKLGQLSSDIRSAFDLAVLNRKPYRLVFMLMSGDYYLESTDAIDFRLGLNDLGRDLTVEEEKEALERFEADFEEYIELAGVEISDPNSDRVFQPESPVVNAKPKLRPVKWVRVDEPGWDVRHLGTQLIIQDFKAEHHDALQTFSEAGEEARAMLYFFPSGYVEKAVIHIAYRMGDNEIDPDQPPYTVVTDPYLGTAEAISGYEEVDIEKGALTPP